jgi:hypothetical protein
MEHLGNLLGHFTVRNDEEVGLFKVLFYENGISFNENFLRGVIEDEATYHEFSVISNEWKNGLKNKESVMGSIMNMFNAHEEHLSEYFISEPIKPIEEKSSSEIYLEYLKANDKLNEITRKDFESKIVDEKIGEFYVDNMNETKNNSKFYTYTSDTTNEKFYVMLVDEKLKIGFAEK